MLEVYIIQLKCEVFTAYFFVVFISHSVMSNLCDPLNSNPPSSSVHGILQARILGVGSHSLLQGIFLTQGLNLGLSHYRQILLTSEPSGKPISYFGCLLFLIDCTLWVICSILNCFLKIVCTIWESSCILRKLENSYVYVQITLQVICDINEE